MNVKTLSVTEIKAMNVKESVQLEDQHAKAFLPGQVKWLSKNLNHQLEPVKNMNGMSKMFVTIEICVGKIRKKLIVNALVS